MNKQLETLIELQKIDLAQEALRMDVEKRREKNEADSENLADLEKALASLSEKLEETRTRLDAKRTALETENKGLEHSETKLNAVTNSRDYAALEREVENFKKTIAQVEKDIEELQKEVADLEAKTAKDSERYEAMKAEIDAERAAVDAAAAAIEGRVAELQAQSNELAKKVPAQILARYRFIRSRRAGVAVVSASTGTCSGCHMRLQPQAFIVLQRQNSLECCQNCQRIIYFDAEEAQAAKEADAKHHKG